jgi:hypothetical protein
VPYVCASDNETAVQDNETHSVHSALQTQEKDTTHPTFESSNETENMAIQQDVSGDFVKEPITQANETISASCHQELSPTPPTLTPDESNKVRQQEETGEKQSKRARKKTKSHKAQKSFTVKKARTDKRPILPLETTLPLQTESSSSTQEPKNCPPTLLDGAGTLSHFPKMSHGLKTGKDARD